MGYMQMLNREESEVDALLDEVQSYIDHDDHVTCGCSIEGCEHMSLVQGIYDNGFHYIHYYILILCNILTYNISIFYCA